MSLGISRCLCGHVGDVSSRPTDPDQGLLNMHLGILGHGKCMHSGCKCRKFRWKEFLAKQEAVP